MLEAPGAFRLDRTRLRASFERASTSYDASSSLQARIAGELLERLEVFRFTPGRVLDLGSGTGRVTRELKRRYPRARVIALDIAAGMLREARRHQWPWRRFDRVCGDASRLPLKDGSIDLIYSNLMLQWCEPLAVTLAEVRRVLKSSGFFAFSTFGPGTLNELRSAWAEADGYNHVNHFSDIHEVGDALVRAGLMEPVLDVDHIEVGYPDVLTLMRDLKAIGAHNVTAGRPRSLSGRARLARVERAYESFRREQRLPATYEVIYGASWGAAGRPTAAAIEGIARIAPGSIRRNRRA
ncbi:MAG TPA: malonyl-ACP O-methyltransferase BioC [Steroidobacteraceae bacterium]|jgi:malonyl-CoA O-methyltransferase|nr:malonyl-ACP O-methyltransferase BioC [Steroidobacteraceae bacterium]